MLPTSGFSLDLSQHYDWANCGYANGIFGVYQCATGVTHPPLSPTMLTISMGLLRALGGDVSYFDNNRCRRDRAEAAESDLRDGADQPVFLHRLQKSGRLVGGVVTAALYWNPGWAVVTAWWGQNDATYSFFMLLTVYLLTRKRPRWMWIAYACAWLAKFQSIMFFPVLAVISLRRFGWRATIDGRADRRG